MTSRIKFDRAELLNPNCGVSSGGETITLARRDGWVVAQIMMSQNLLGLCGSEYRVSDYEVEWMDGRDDEGRDFFVRDFANARAALVAARNYIRKES